MSKCFICEYPMFEANGEYHVFNWSINQCIDGIFKNWVPYGEDKQPQNCEKCWGVLSGISVTYSYEKEYIEVVRRYHNGREHKIDVFAKPFSDYTEEQLKIMLTDYEDWREQLANI